MVSSWLGTPLDRSFMSMRDVLYQLPVFSLLSTTAPQPSLHDSAGVLAFVNPKIGTYGVTPNGNGGMVLDQVLLVRPY